VSAAIDVPDELGVSRQKKWLFKSWSCPLWVLLGGIKLALITKIGGRKFWFW
jgi:hypothetical protein